MTTNRRAVLGGLAFAASGLTASRSHATGKDGHAAGYDVAPSSDHVTTIPRKGGDPVKFSTSLDAGPIKATSGGWARDVTARNLPIATDIAGAHLFLNPGGVREMHWHNSAEWAYIVAGHCQVTVVDPEGETEVANYDPGDLWYFPKGHSHAIQTLGSEPCHAILAFDDGLYGEHGTFGLSDWISRLDGAMVAQVAGVSKDVVAQMPPGEVYIMQGAVIGRDSAQARDAKPLNRRRTHRFALMTQPPRSTSAAGTIHIASAREFPMSTTLTGMVLRLNPGGYHEPHWHPHANEWHYVAKGKARVTLFATDKRLASAELAAGDCAYIPRGCGHCVQNIGSAECELVGVLDSGKYQAATLSDWMSKAPRHLLANNLGIPEAAFAGGRKGKSMLMI
ncbi:MAG: cupin domain-containing protein [Alphaproteobacteria bacterium]|nr:cupin domain-containing protein [Alphaproteobacteria bacterium]